MFHPLDALNDRNKFDVNGRTEQLPQDNTIATTKNGTVPPSGDGRQCTGRKNNSSFKMLVVLACFPIQLEAGDGDDNNLRGRKTIVPLNVCRSYVFSNTQLEATTEI